MAHDVAQLVILCLEERCTPGPCGPEDPWDEALAVASGEPQEAWLFLTAFLTVASTERQFGRLGAGPLSYFWSDHGDTYIHRLPEVAPKLPQLINLLIAVDRRRARALDVMFLVEHLAHDRRRAAGEFTYSTSAALEAFVTVGAHALTEQLLLPNIHEFKNRAPLKSAPTDADIATIVDGYIQKPFPSEDPDEEDWWWALNDLVTYSPRMAWRAILQIIAREEEGVDLNMLGAGALETLISDHGELLCAELLMAIKTNEKFVRAFSSCYLFSLSERVLIQLAQTCRRILRAG